MNTNLSCRGGLRFWLLCIALVFTNVSCQRNEDTQSRATERFPDIQLHGLAASSITTASMRGKVVVLNIWATWCPPCRKEMPSLERLAARVDSQRVAVIGLSVESDDHQVREWLKQSGITFANYLDLGTPSARELLRITSYPQTFLVSSDGFLLARYEGRYDWDDPGWLAIIDRALTTNRNEATSAMFAPPPTRVRG